MNIKKVLCVVSALALAASSMAQTQSLIELAKLEKQRRARVRASGGTARVYTEGDRSTTTTPEPIAAEGTAAPDPLAATAAPGAKKEKTREELEMDKQKEWAARLKAAQDEIATVEQSISRNERNLASMLQPTPARQDVVNTIEADKKRLGNLRQSLLSLEDERRRAGMPRR